MEAFDVAAQELAEGAVFQLGGWRGVGVEVGGDVAVAIVAGQEEVCDLRA